MMLEYSQLISFLMPPELLLVTIQEFLLSWIMQQIKFHATCLNPQSYVCGCECIQNCSADKAVVSVMYPFLYICYFFTSMMYMKYCVIFQIASVLTEFSAEDCWSLGLNKANLLCSSCDNLPTFELDILK